MKENERHNKPAGAVLRTSHIHTPHNGVLLEQTHHSTFVCLCYTGFLLFLKSGSGLIRFVSSRGEVLAMLRAAAAVLAPLVLFAQRAHAPPAEYSFDFLAAQPDSYNHKYSGGAWDEERKGIDTATVCCCVLLM